MSDEGKKILESTRNFRKYLEDIGRLLSKAEIMMLNHGYEAVPDNTALVGAGASIKKPEQWLLQDAFRFFRHKKNKHILAVVSVIIDDLHEPSSICQPIVSALWFNYENEVKKKPEQKESKNAWMYKFSRTMLKLEKPDLGGKMIDIFPELEEYFGKSGILASQALAVPLVDFQSERDIEKKIITPLVESLNGELNR